MPYEAWTFEVIQRCHFKAHPCQNCGKAKTNPIHRGDKPECEYKRKLGCAVCGKAKGHEDHMGAAPSLNILGSGNARAYMNLKKSWEALLMSYLVRLDIPKGMESVVVSALVVFPNLTHRDEGNIRFLLEKCMGDVLQEGGWIGDDCFYPTRKYTFGQLEAEHRPGVAGVIFTVSTGS